MQKAQTILIFVFILAVLVAPVLSLAQSGSAQVGTPSSTFKTDSGLIPCGHSDKSGAVANPCTFRHFMVMINRLIDFVFKYLALPIAAIMFVYAGFKLVTSGGSTEARGTAKRVFINTALGLILAVAAWLIVRTLLSIAGYTDVGLFF